MCSGVDGLFVLVEVGIDWVGANSFEEVPAWTLMECVELDRPEDIAGALGVQAVVAVAVAAEQLRRTGQVRFAGAVEDNLVARTVVVDIVDLSNV